MANSGLFQTFDIPGSGGTDWGEVLGQALTLALMIPKIRERYRREKQLRRVGERIRAGVAGAPGAARVTVQTAAPEAPSALPWPDLATAPVRSGGLLGPVAEAGSMLPWPEVAGQPQREPQIPQMGTGGVDAYLQSPEFRAAALEAAGLGDPQYVGKEWQPEIFTPEERARAARWGAGFELSPAEREKERLTTERSVTTAAARGSYGGGSSDLATVDLPDNLADQLGWPRGKPFPLGLKSLIAPKISGATATRNLALREMISQRSELAKADFARADAARARGANLEEQSRIDGVDRRADIEQQNWLAEQYEDRAIKTGTTQILLEADVEAETGRKPTVPGTTPAGKTGLITTTTPAPAAPAPGKIIMTPPPGAPPAQTRMGVEHENRMQEQAAGKEEKGGKLSDAEVTKLTKQVNDYFEIANGGGTPVQVKRPAPGIAGKYGETVTISLSPREAMGETAFQARAQAALVAYNRLAATGQLPAGLRKPMSSPARGGRRAQAGAAPAAQPNAPRTEAGKKLAAEVYALRPAGFVNKYRGRLTAQELVAAMVAAGIPQGVAAAALVQ